MDTFVEDVQAALSTGRHGLFGQCERDSGGLKFVGNGDAPRELTVPDHELQRLATAYAACEPAKKDDFVECACRAYVGGAADVPTEWTDARWRLLPQLWPLSKILAKQEELRPSGVVLPWCGVNGESSEIAKKQYDCGVVVVCDFSTGKAVCETPVLTRDMARWTDAPTEWVEVLRVAMENLRRKTKDFEASKLFKGRWDHHQSGCGSTMWRDRFDSARCALLPSLVAKRKRTDGGREPGAHVAVFASRDCALATTAKNAVALCYLGDVLHLKMKPSAPMVSTQAYRLVKVKKQSGEHPLVQKAGEGLAWKWLPFRPSAGEYSVPWTSEQVDAILAALEAGETTIPVFGETEEDRVRVEGSRLCEESKALGNAAFLKNDFAEALKRYEAAIAFAERGLKQQDNEEKRAAVLHSNAAAALLKLPLQKEEAAARALKHAMRAVELDPTYAKAHNRMSSAFELLGEPVAAKESAAKATKITAAEKAEKAALRDAEIAKRQVKLDEQHARRELKKKEAEEKAEKATQRALKKKQEEEDRASSSPRTTITLDGGASMRDIAGMEGYYSQDTLPTNNFAPYVATKIH